MLTSDLVRARVRKGVVVPDYVDPEDEDVLDGAATLVAIFEEAVGGSKGALDDAVAEVTADETGFLLYRGLAKLLLDRCTFETESDLEPMDLRRAVFDAAAAAHRRGDYARDEALAAATATLSLAPEGVEAGLFADLKSEQVVTAFEPCTTRWLLERYNVALAQAVLYKATELVIEIAGQKSAVYRDLFRRMKFHQLLYRVEAIDDGYRILLDGPVSLFRSSQRYGLSMASFLPGLLHCEGWTLEATVLWGKGRSAASRKERRFLLEHRKPGLEPYTKGLKGQWQPDEIHWLAKTFQQLDQDPDDGWTIRRGGKVVDLGGQDVLVPDYEFTHADGTKVAMEVFGFWRKGALARRLEMLAELGRRDVMIAIGRDLKVDEADLADLGDSVYVFRSAPIAKEVLERLEVLRGG